MLAIVAIALIACYGVRRKLVEKGYPESRAWLSPLRVSVVVLIVSQLASFLPGWLFDKADSPIALLYPKFLFVLAVTVQGVFIATFWKKLGELPQRNSET